MAMGVLGFKHDAQQKALPAHQPRKRISRWDARDESRNAMIDMSLQPDTGEVLAGLIERVTYHNAENGFCVLRTRARGHREVVTVVGHAEFAVNFAGRSTSTPKVGSVRPRPAFFFFELNGTPPSPTTNELAARGVHLAFSASEVFAGVAVSDLPLPYAVLIYRFPSFVIFVVQPVFQVITAELPSSFQVPVIPSPRVAFAAPPLDSVISNGCPAVSFTFHTPSNTLWATVAKHVPPKKQAAVTAAIAAFLIFVPPCKFAIKHTLPFPYTPFSDRL